MKYNFDTNNSINNHDKIFLITKSMKIRDNKKRHKYTAHRGFAVAHLFAMSSQSGGSKQGRWQKIFQGGQQKKRTKISKKIALFASSKGWGAIEKKDQK